MANPCPTMDFIGLPLGPTAEGWPWWACGCAGGDLPSGGKRTCPGGGIEQRTMSSSSAMLVKIIPDRSKYQTNYGTDGAKINVEMNCHLSII